MAFKKKIAFFIFIYLLILISCNRDFSKKPKIVINKKDTGIDNIESIKIKFKDSPKTTIDNIKNKKLNKESSSPTESSSNKDLNGNLLDSQGKIIIKKVKKRKHHKYLKKASNKKLELTKIYILGAIPSMDKDHNIIKLQKGISTYTYRIMGELHNKGEENITKKEGIYLLLEVFFREKDGFKHYKYKTRKYKLEELSEFDHQTTKIAIPIKANGGMRLFEFKVHQIPESDHKVGLFITLRNKKEIWSTHYIALHRPAPPPIKEGFFDFLKRPTSTKWWYLTLSLGLIAIIIAVIAIL